MLFSKTNEQYPARMKPVEQKNGYLSATSFAGFRFRVFVSSMTSL